jgi:hypothetical protein
MTMRDDARISYVNRTVVHLVDVRADGTEVEAEVSKPQRDRRIFFHMSWLTDLVRAMARNADAELARGPVPRPATWWVSPETV